MLNKSDMAPPFRNRGWLLYIWPRLGMFSPTHLELLSISLCSLNADSKSYVCLPLDLMSVSALD